MPDLITVFSRWWKWIIGMTVLAALAAFIATLLSPKEYLSEATALPANSVVADKARLFNTNIEALYSELGSPDELDRMEGTGLLDTLYLAVARGHNLAQKYGMGNDAEGLFKAARKLKKNSRIARSGFGELKIKVWDENRDHAAQLANSLLDGMQSLHQQLQNENNLAILDRLRADYGARQTQYRALSDSMKQLAGADAELVHARRAAVFEQLVQYEKLVDQYTMAAATNPQVLLTVERARPSPWPDKPRTLQTVLLAIIGAGAFAWIVALFMDRKRKLA